jgi:UDP-GlcNAc:undecaprenyl-phosphate GlcNAc-1-phosphate transferase
MPPNANLLVFAVAFIGCVLATPLVTRMAGWAGAIDRPDRFRRIHKGAVPRLGGLSLATGLAVAALPAVAGGLAGWPRLAEWSLREWPILLAVAIVTSLGVLDDSRGVGPRLKLLVQASAVLVLFAGGLRITHVTLMGRPIDLSYPVAFRLGEWITVVDLLSLAVTMAWFLGCMNIWNLIDGMDGLASGVGLLVSGTLMLVALRQGNPGAAALAAALAGSLAAFLLYNWHPACIFLGDSGSLLIGLLIGVIGVKSSMKGTAAVSILFPILAMGLPVSDTAMAIFRRWARDLPLSSADRQHVHHILIGLGLNPRQAALMLYCFSAFLCGVVLLGVAWNNPVHGEFLALVLGISGCLAFLLILTSRRDELNGLWRDLHGRFGRKAQERRAATLTWEAIQKIELCETGEGMWEILLTTARRLGCDGLRLSCARGGRELLRRSSGPIHDGPNEGAASGASARFRLHSGEDLRLIVALRHTAGAEIEPDIAFRALHRLARAMAERVERLLSGEEAGAGGPLSFRGWAARPPGGASELLGRP